VFRLKKKIALPVSISEELAMWISHESEHSEFRNRSHLVEQAIKDFKQNEEKQ